MPRVVPTDSSYNNWQNYRFSTKTKRLGGVDVYGYTILFFRYNPATDSGYALFFRQTGVCEFYKRNNGVWGDSFTAFTIPKDNDWHDVIIEVVNDTVKVWFDKTEDQTPNLEYNTLDYLSGTKYTSGTVALGTYAWNSQFDDVQISNDLTVAASPPRFYTSGSHASTSISIKSSSDLDNLSISVTNPTGTISGLKLQILHGSVQKMPR